MKEKIINFLKLKTHPEAKFIILGLFYIIAMNVMTLFRIFDLLIFFCIYFCIKHLNTKPTLSKKRMLLSSTIIFIFVLEIWILINYISFICFSPFFYSNINLYKLSRQRNMWKRKSKGQSFKEKGKMNDFFLSK